MNENVLTTKNPFFNKWFCFLEHVASKNISGYDDDGEKTLRKLSRIAEFLEKTDMTGDAMLIEDLIEAVQDKYILDYDGTGYYVSFTDFSKTSIYSVEDIEDLKSHAETHFVIWYNK